MTPNLSRRSFLALSAAASIAPALAAKNVPVGLELFSVRDQLAKDLTGTVTAVAKMGYQVVEFYAPYFEWSVDQTKDVRKLLDELGIRCLSTHNGPNAFKGDGIAKAIERNNILGAKYIVMASAGAIRNGLDGWRGVGETLTKANEQFRPAGLHAGYHNHKPEFDTIDGKRPMDVIAANTPKDVMLQFDVGTCLEAGQDPIAWIDANPGRIKSLHLKDWNKAEGYKVLFGEGVAPWKKIFAAAESKGGVEYYLIEQEGSRFDPFETAEKCLASYKKIHG